METKKIAVIILIILALGAGGYYFYSKDNDSARYPFGIEVVPTVTPLTGNSSDSDKDGLPDTIEKVLGTNINNMDTDSDTYSDLDEIKNGYDPLVAGSTKLTTEEWQALQDKIKAADKEFYEKNFTVTLLYEADLTNIVSYKKDRAILGVLEVVKMRLQSLNIKNFTVQIKNENYLEVSFPNIEDVSSITNFIQEAPVVEFRIESSKEEFADFFKRQNGKEMPKELAGPYFLPTDLVGKNIASSEFGLDPVSEKPIVNIEFNEEGKKIFTDITAKNIGKKFAVYLNGEIITAPVISESITEGKAVIAGAFSGEEAALLVKRLNGGIFSVPIKLISKTDQTSILNPSSTGLPFICGTTTIKDIDSNIYNTVKIGEQCWLKQNLKVTKNPEGKTIDRDCYNNDPDICNTDGGLYTWLAAMNIIISNIQTFESFIQAKEPAQGICPDGWHIPRDSEWSTIENYLEENKAKTASGSFMSCSGADGYWIGCGSAGIKLKQGGSSGFEAVYAGSVENTHSPVALPNEFWYKEYLYKSNWEDTDRASKFNSRGESAYFWSSTSLSPVIPQGYPNTRLYEAWFRKLSSVHGGTLKDDAVKNRGGMSVRCLKD